jgi:hypothetical protein
MTLHKAVSLKAFIPFRNVSINRNASRVPAIDKDPYVTHELFSAALVHTGWNAQQQTFLIVVRGADVSEVGRVKTSHITFLISCTDRKAIVSDPLLRSDIDQKMFGCGGWLLR